MHVVVTIQPDLPAQLLQTAHRWLTATGGSDRFSFEISGQRIDFAQPCAYSDKLKRDLCKLLGDNNAVTVIDEPMKQLSLIDVPIATHYD